MEDPNPPPEAIVLDQYDVIEVLQTLARSSEAVSRVPTLSDRRGRKGLLARLGVTGDTGDNYRMVLYKDTTQSAILIGEIDEAGSLTFNKSATLAGDPNELRKTEEGRARMSNLLLCDPLRDLPRSITIPAADARPEWEGSKEKEKPKHVPSANLRFTENGMKHLTRDVTLLACADAATSQHCVHVHGSNRNLPRTPSPQRGRTV